MDHPGAGQTKDPSLPGDELERWAEANLAKPLASAAPVFPQPVRPQHRRAVGSQGAVGAVQEVGPVHVLADEHTVECAGGHRQPAERAGDLLRWRRGEGEGNGSGQWGSGEKGTMLGTCLGRKDTASGRASGGQSWRLQPLGKKKDGDFQFCWSGSSSSSLFSRVRWSQAANQTSKVFIWPHGLDTAMSMSTSCSAYV